MIIAIIGPDGSGKTTIAEWVVKELKKRGICARHYSFNFGILPRLSALRVGREAKCTDDIHSNNADSYANAHYDLSVNSPLRSFIYMTWYAIDYFVGGLILRAKRLVGQRPQVAVFARYFYDYYYQSNNRRLSPKLKQCIEVIVPRPDFIFFLDRDARAIHDAKPELPVDEIKYQQQIILERLSTYPQFHVIDARAGIEPTVRKVLEVIRAGE